MKSPEELRKLTATIFNCRSIGNTPDAVAILEQLQAAAYDQGMRAAAEMIDPFLETSDCTACNRHLKNVQEAILEKTKP